MMFLGLILNLFIFGLVIYGIRKLFSHRKKGVAKEGGVRRFFQLLLLFGLSIISAVGISGLLGRLIHVGTVISNDKGTLAMESAFTLVGFPIFIAIAFWTRNTVKKDPEELKTYAWNLYLTGISLLSLILLINAQMNIYNGWFTSAPIHGKDFSQLLIWSIIWFFHFRLHNQIGRDENSQVEHFVGSLIGLAFSFAGLIQISAGILERISSFNQNTLVSSSDKPLINGLIALMIGGPIWFIYWIKTFQKEPKSTLWYAYVLLIGVGGGLLTLLISLSLVIDKLLVWFIGEVNGQRSAFFSAVPTMLGTALCAAIVLWYHRQVLENSQQIGRTDIRRIYEYAIAAIGLLAASSGFTMILVSILQSIASSNQISGESSINTLLAAVTLIGVGGPVWWLQWESIQKKTNANSAVEQSSFIRRLYLLLLFGVVGITAVIVLLVTAYLLFYDLFQYGISLGTLNKIKYPVGIFLTALVISTFHWNIYRHEKHILVNRGHSVTDVTKIYFFVEIKIKPEHTEKLIDVLIKYIAHVRKEKGCEQIDILVDPELKNQVCMYEIWSDAQSHQAHLESPGFIGWKEYSDPLIIDLRVKTLKSAEL